MHRSGILILTHHVSTLCRGDAVKNIVAGIKDVVSSTLYVHVANTSPQMNLPAIECNQDQLAHLLMLDTNSLPYHMKERCFSSDVFPFLSKFYAETSRQCRQLDVNILLHNIGLHQSIPFNLKRHVQCIIADRNSQFLQQEKVKSSFQGFVKSLYSKELHQELPLISVDHELDDSALNASSPTDRIVNSKGSIVIGGTYDHIHPGHKVLLSEATLLTHRKLVIGLTDGTMLERKMLSDLIEPWERRKEQLTQFLCDIAPFHPFLLSGEDGRCSCSRLGLDIARITDPVGPAGTDPDLQCIVVSKETVKGGDFVNETRRKNGLNPLEVHIIGEGGLVDDQHGLESPMKETKFSSSTMRYDSLGTLRREPNRRNDDSFCGAYVIGLTGGIASGKSSVAKRLSDRGATVIDCDKLGHAAYVPGTRAFAKVVECFGRDVVSASGEIDRKALAAKVFTSDSSEKRPGLKELNAIVWPEIERLARDRIREAITNRSSDQEKVVCVLDAAVLLEAGWNRFVDEVWVCIIPVSEASKRVRNRDGKTQAEAEKRINAQISGSERARQAHVVLSTLWEPSVTEEQVKNAWNRLEKRLSPNWKYDEDSS